MKDGTGRSAQSKVTRRLLVASLAAVTLAGCQTGASQGPRYTGSIGTTAVLSPSDLSPEQALQAVQKWGAAYSRNEKDKVAALNFAAALRAAGETKQAVAVMRKSAIYHASDREVLAAFGKALAGDGQFKEALSTVRRAQRADNPDWQLLATEGGILDSIGQQDQARDLYRQALILAPGEPQILNNLGMSYVLTNELDRAEEVLGQAAASPKATLKIRQNLALVQGLKKEGGQRAKPPSDADVISAPQDGVLQQDTWQELARNG
jgi:Flp pilus assembly protein TadD